MRIEKVGRLVYECYLESYETEVQEILENDEDAFKEYTQYLIDKLVRQLMNTDPEIKKSQCMVCAEVQLNQENFDLRIKLDFSENEIDELALSNMVVECTSQKEYLQIKGILDLYYKGGSLYMKGRRGYFFILKTQNLSNKDFNILLKQIQRTECKIRLLNLMQAVYEIRNSECIDKNVHDNNLDW